LSHDLVGTAIENQRYRRHELLKHLRGSKAVHCRHDEIKHNQIRAQESRRPDCVTSVYCFTARSEVSFAPECVDQRLPAGVIVIHNKNASWIARYSGRRMGLSADPQALRTRAHLWEMGDKWGNQWRFEHPHLGFLRSRLSCLAYKRFGFAPCGMSSWPTLGSSN
jgi:hypothetical protein